MGVRLTASPFSGVFVLVVVVASVLKIHEIRQKQKKIYSEVREYAVLNTRHETFSQYHTPQGDLKKSKPEKNDYLNMKKKRKKINVYPIGRSV